MGIFKMFKKNKSSPSDPPVPEQNIKPPVEIPNQESNQQFQDPFQSNQNNEQENMGFPNQEEVQPPMEESISDMPPPPAFDKASTDSQPNTNQNIEKPFNPEVPDFNNSNNQVDFNSSSDLPNPFDSEFDETNDNQNQSFAEKFGTVPQDSTEENQFPEQNIPPEEVPQQNIPQESFQEPVQEKFPNQLQDNEPSDLDEEHDEPFSFSGNQQSISERELPLDQTSSNEEIHEPMSKKIEQQIEEHVSKLKTPALEEDLEEKENKFTFSKKSDLHNKPNLSASSFFIGVEGCSTVNNKIVEVKDLINYIHDVNMKISDIEKKSDAEYSNWKKNMEEVHSSLLSIDKKLFR